MAAAQGNALDHPPSYDDCPPSYDEVMKDESKKDTPHDDGNFFAPSILHIF